jgi:AAA15 family ATPase/GTPase
MLIRFSFGNWRSFRDEATFSMIAGSERAHGDRLARVNKFDLRLLPATAIYGGNASGKSNFVMALAFARALMVIGTKTDDLIAVDPFLLDTDSPEAPCTFRFELLINEVIYDYRFRVTRDAVVEEKLVLVNSASETVLFHRKKNTRKLKLSESLKEHQFLQFIYKGTRANELYVNVAASRNVKDFQAVFDWFKTSLVLIDPETRIQQFEYYLQRRNPRHGTMSRVLAQLDTGIDRLGSEEIPLESLPLPEEVVRHLKETTKKGTTSRIHFSKTNDRIVLTREQNLLEAERIVTMHRRSDGTEATFELNRESSGTQRVLDLLPLFIEAASSSSGTVFVIDELDRSLHTLLTRQLLEAYLATCNEKTRSQVIFTTHDVLLMDQELLRRDEMWVTERDREGNSNLISLAEYKDIRVDTDLRKRYLQGRYGGIPQILLAGGLTEERGEVQKSRGAR